MDVMFTLRHFQTKKLHILLTRADQLNEGLHKTLIRQFRFYV